MSNSTTRAIIEEEKRAAEKRQADEAMRQKQENMRAAREQFDQRILDLADKALEFQRTRGEQDPITEILTTFLEVSLELRDTMQTLEAITGAMQCVTEAISFMDNAINVDQDMMDMTLEHKYTAFTRIKQRIKHYRVMRNQKARTQMIVSQIAAKMKMAQDMVQGMRAFSESMKRSMEKKNKKRKGSAPTNSRAAAFLASRAQETGAASGSAPSGPAPAAPTTMSDSGSGASTGGVNIFPHSN